MKTHLKYLTEARLTPTVIQHGIDLIKALEKKQIKITDWDSRGNVEIHLPGKPREWYKESDAVNLLLTKL